MCLLVFAWQTEPGFPLVVAANRDERLDRPARSLCVLNERDPRILGGRDDLAGGTWLAVNEHGVVAGLTNRPSPGGRDPTKRSRGELPLVLAGRRTAEAGVHDLIQKVQPGLYNPAWLLVGDRESLFYLELAPDQPPSISQLSPGIHILENVGLWEPSPKAARVHSLVDGAGSGTAPLWTLLPSVLADHTIPRSTDGEEGPADEAVTRLPATLAACVHTEEYGTRSAALARVASDPGRRPELLVADGPPCTDPFIAASFDG
ncbi:MAG: NRDE family protein [Acidimicrobiales bacterium]|jgi:uncharacterized protein with NRDE domain